MFSENLSVRVLQILDSKDMSYEVAAELCGMSPRNMGNIIRNRVQPKLFTVEKLCNGLEVTPNELLLEKRSKQTPKKVTMVKALCSGGSYYPVCPGCQITLEREYQNYCDRCGQRLDWSGFDTAIVLLPGMD